MDKERRRTKMMVQRKGFALLITLSVLTVVIALTTMVLEYFTQAKRDADHSAALLQANLYFATVAKGFAAIPQQKELLTFLYKTPIPLATPDGRGSIFLQCTPASSGVNINWLALENDQNATAKYEMVQKLFEYLVQEYAIQNPDQLEERLLHEIGTKEENRNIIVTTLSGRLRQKNGIISAQQLDRILTEYQTQADDQDIFKVPWSDYFSFYGDKIDIENASAKLISYLFEIDTTLVEEWKNELESPSLEQFVTQNGGEYTQHAKLFVTAKEIGESHCKVGFIHNMASYHFEFYYAQGEAKYFEFHQEK